LVLPLISTEGLKNICPVVPAEQPNSILHLCEKKGHYYVGSIIYVEKRLWQHGNPKLLYKEGPLEKHDAAKRERQIKKWSRIKKERLIGRG